MRATRSQRSGRQPRRVRSLCSTVASIGLRPPPRSRRMKPTADDTPVTMRRREESGEKREERYFSLLASLPSLLSRDCHTPYKEIRAYACSLGENGESLMSNGRVAIV